MDVSTIEEMEQPSAVSSGAASVATMCSRDQTCSCSSRRQHAALLNSVASFGRSSRMCPTSHMHCQAPAKAGGHILSLASLRFEH
eukprot:803726-Amphidinium_carterae.2